MLKSEARYLKSISYPSEFFQSTHGHCMGESNTSIPTPDKMRMHLLAAYYEWEEKEGKKKKRHNPACKRNKAAMFCFTAMLWKMQNSIPARLLFPQRGSKENQHNCNPPWDAEQLEKGKELTTFTTTQTTETQL